MSKKDWFYFLEPWDLVLGIFLGIMLSIIKYIILDTYSMLSTKLFFSVEIIRNDILLIAVISIFFWTLCISKNIFDYIFNEKRNFTKNNSQLSAEKQKALGMNVPREYLSKEIEMFTLGRYHNRYFHLPLDPNNITHTLILGGPGSGKSTTLLSSLIYNYNFLEKNKKSICFCTDVKPEMSYKSVDESREDIHIINPSITTGYGWDVWYGLEQNSSDDALIERADQIVRAIIVNPNNTENVFFYSSARILLKAFIVYGCIKGNGFVDSILQVIHVPLQDLITQVLLDEEMINHPKITGMIQSYEGKDSDAIQDVEMTLKLELSIFEIDSVRYQFQENPKKASPMDLTDGISIFLAIPNHLLHQYSAIFRLLTVMTLRYLASIPEADRSQKDVPIIWLLLDEFGSINKIDGILESIALLRSRKVSIWLCNQTLAQIDMTYSHDGCRQIIDNCTNTIIFSCNDKQTADMLSAWAGQYEENKQSISKKGSDGILSEKSYTDSKQYHNILDVSDILQLRKNNKVLIFSEGYRFLIDKCPYYLIPKLNEVSKRIMQKNQEV